MIGYVYAMERHDGLIKIGWSLDPFRRLGEVCRSDGRHKLLAFAKGEKSHERQAHETLAAHHWHREWFFPHRHVLAFVGLLPLSEQAQVEVFECTQPFSRAAISTVPDLIDSWPSLTAFAADAGVAYGTAKQMRRRGSIDLSHWDKLIGSAQGRDLGVTSEVLHRLHVAHGSPTPAPAPEPAS